MCDDSVVYDLNDDEGFTIASVYRSFDGMFLRSWAGAMESVVKCPAPRVAHANVSAALARLRFFVAI